MARKKNYTNKQKIAKSLEYRHFKKWQKRNALLRLLYSSNESFHSKLHKDYVEKIKTGQPIAFENMDAVDAQIRMLKMIMDEYDQVHVWMSQIPPLNFKSEWDVQIVPPVTGADVRFRVNDFVSVYLDVHDRLGFMNRPYWEMYDGDETYRFRLEDAIGLMAAIEEVIEQHDIAKRETN